MFVPHLLLTLVACDGSEAPPPPSDEAPSDKAPTGAAASIPVATTGAWTVPVDVNNGKNATQGDYYTLAWQTFVALNWPATAPGGAAPYTFGQPNQALSLGARTAPTGPYVPPVWATWRDLDSTMLEGPTDPGAWDASVESLPSYCTAPPAGSVPDGFQPLIVNDITKSANGFKSGVNAIDEASGNPVIDQYGRYVVFDIRLSQSEYDYIETTGYWNGQTQYNAVTTNNGAGFVGLPRTGQETTFPTLPAYAQFGALEVKTAWRRLGAGDDPSRYFTQTGYFLQPDGTTCEGPAVFGLIGLHILRLTPTTPGTWFSATFEQIDNTTVGGGANPPAHATLAANGTPNGACTSAYNVAPAAIAEGANVPWTDANPPVNVCRVDNVPADVAAVNQTWQNQAPVQGTVWANYQLVGTVNPTVAGETPVPLPVNGSVTVNTTFMANTSMETYAQTATSCVSCHAYGAPCGATPSNNFQNGTFQIFTFALSNADGCPNN